MSKVRPTTSLDQLDLGFGSAENLKAKKQMPLKTGPSPFDAKLENAVTEREAQRVLRSMQAEKVVDAASKAEAEKHQKALREYVSGQRSAASLSGIGSESPMKVIKKPYKAGGKVSKALKSAGFYDKGKTKSEREKIVSKVTTKPQRLGMVERMFSTKKMKAGGMASKRADGIAIRGRTKA